MCVSFENSIIQKQISVFSQLQVYQNLETDIQNCASVLSWIVKLNTSTLFAFKSSMYELGFQTCVVFGVFDSFVIMYITN